MKKTITTILTLVCMYITACMFSFSTGCVSAAGTLKGDISGNGKIDLYDAIEIAKSLVGTRTFNDEEKEIADFNEDGKVDLYDAIAIAKYMLNHKDKENGETSENVFYITANDTTFKAKFAENSSADAFRELLEKDDLTINMHDYGNFEKVGSIGTTLPQNNEQITTVPGDVILYQGNSITVYYDKNSWNFTRLGKIENVNKEELLDVLGNGDVDITFSIKK